MIEVSKIVKYNNETEGIAFQPFPPTNADLAAGSEYDAATISGIVFGIFMALLAIYSIWQYSRQYTGKLYGQFKTIRRLNRTHIVFIGHLLQHYQNDTNTPENRDVEMGTLDSAGNEYVNHSKDN